MRNILGKLVLDMPLSGTRAVETRMPGERCQAMTADQADPQRIVRAAALLRDAVALLDAAGERLAAIAAYHALTLIDPAAREMSDDDGVTP